MSHTSTISRVRIMDIDALRAAINELSESGTPVHMEEGGTPRAYYQNQEGLGPAENVIRLGGGCPYDIGVYPAADGRGHELRSDLFLDRVAEVVGVDPSPFIRDDMTPEERVQVAGQASMGRIYQRYAVVASEREAARQGHSTQRVLEDDGEMSLRVGLAA